jgi:HSP20 family protein
MALVPWKKREEERPMLSLQREMNRLFDDFFGRDFGIEPFRGPGQWVPALDVSESDKAVLVKAELPGLDVKDVEVSIAGNVLTLRGEKKEEKEEKAKNYHRVERSYGAFERAVQLPCPVKGDLVQATFKNGILTVELPKSEEVRSKSVKIRTG